MKKLKKCAILYLFASITAFASPWRVGGMNDPKYFKIKTFKYENIRKSAKLTKIPASSAHWLHKNGGVSWRYQTPEDKKYKILDKKSIMKMGDLSKLSPAEKYDMALGRYDFPLTKQERVSMKNFKYDWEGHCHGWTAASLKYKVVSKNIKVTNPDGLKIIFTPQDTLALLSYFEGVLQTPWDYWLVEHKLPWYLSQHLKNPSQIRIIELLDTLQNKELKNKLKTSYLKNTKDIQTLNANLMREVKAYRLSFYSPYVGVKNSSEKHQQNDPNPGALHLILNYAIAEKNQGFIADTDSMSPVWNRPIYGYETHELSKKKIKGIGQEIELKVKIFFIKELTIPEVGTIKREKSIEYKELHYYLDLNLKGEITGGSWAKGSERLDFIWSPFFNTMNDYSVDAYYDKALIDKLISEQ